MVNLIAAMLKVSVSDAVKPMRKITADTSKHNYYAYKAESENQKEALQWIFSDDSREFSFLWACSMCDMEPERIRQMILKQPAALHRRIQKEQYMMNKPRRVGELEKEGVSNDEL